MNLPSRTSTRRRFCGTLLGSLAVLSLKGAAAVAPPAVLPIGPLPDSKARIVTLDPRFGKLWPMNPVISRLQTGSTWSEGPAWCPAGRYLVWSDIPNDRQLRWLEDDGHVSEFRRPSGKTNGSTFDFLGRMICCEQTGHRVVRHEPDGSVNVLADHADGVRLNSPNDVVVHPDGAIWFTDPGYGAPDPLPQKEAIYRLDPETKIIERVSVSLTKPNGLCFSPDFKLLYLADTGTPQPQSLHVFDVVNGRRLANQRLFATMEYNGMSAGPDGQQVDVEGNLWASAGHGPEGINGVHVFAPDGKRLGMILLPETCANVCFGGSRRDQLFMTATSSLYVLTTGTRGAHGS